MSAEIDALIRKGKSLEIQIEQLSAELSRLREEIAEQMGEETEYYGKGVVAKKWARLRWEVDRELLLDELPRDSLDYFKEVVFNKGKMDQAMKAGHLPPRLYERAMNMRHEGWNVSLKILDAPAKAVDRAFAEKEE